MTQANAYRREVEAELAYLRTFSNVYRKHLHAYLDALLRNVEEWERAKRTSLASVVVQQSRLPQYPQPPAPTR